MHLQPKTWFVTSLNLTPLFTPIFLTNKFRKLHGMLQVTARVAVQLAASGHPCIISKSRIGGFIRKWCHCECGAVRTSTQSAASGHHWITASYLIIENKLSQEKDVTVNAAPLETLSNWQPKDIYPSSLVLAKKVSLDKGPNHEFSAARIMTKRTCWLGRIQDKRKIYQKKRVSQA